MRKDGTSLGLCCTDPTYEKRKRGKAEGERATKIERGGGWGEREGGKRRRLASSVMTEWRNGVEKNGDARE
jgi:hypothetical protein